MGLFARLVRADQPCQASSHASRYSRLICHIPYAQAVQRWTPRHQLPPDNMAAFPPSQIFGCAGPGRQASATHTDADFTVLHASLKSRCARRHIRTRPVNKTSPAVVLQSYSALPAEQWDEAAGCLKASMLEKLQSRYMHHRPRSRCSSPPRRSFSCCWSIQISKACCVHTPCPGCSRVAPCMSCFIRCALLPSWRPFAQEIEVQEFKSESLIACMQMEQCRHICEAGRNSTYRGMYCCCCLHCCASFQSVMLPRRLLPARSLQLSLCR